MIFVTNNNTSVEVPYDRASFDRALQATHEQHIRRIVRNWSIYVSTSHIVVYNAHGLRDSYFARTYPVSRLNSLVEDLPLSVSRLVVQYIENYWSMPLVPPVVRDMAGLSNRTFGVEFEFCFPANWTRETLCRHMNDMGVDIFCCSGYSHEVRSNWKMTTDGSVHSEREGYNTCEISSPILHGREGLLEVNKMCQILDDCGCVVNKSCGFHVHHGARDLTEAQRLNVMKFYRDNEEIIDTIVSRSRRGNTNSYCKTLCGLDLRVPPSDRYRKVNYCSYSRYGTLEFRQHQGTINYQKVANWIKLTQRIMEVSPEKVRRYSSLEQMLHALDLDILIDFFTTRARELA